MAQIECTFPEHKGLWLEGVKKFNEHLLREHFSYSDGEPIAEKTLEDFEIIKENVKWLLLNRKGCTGDDRLVQRWYETDFLRMWKYDSATQGFKPIIESLTIEVARLQPSPDSITRARQDIQMQAEIRIIAMAKAGLPPNPEDLKLLPTDMTILKRRHRTGIMKVIMQAEGRDAGD